MASRIIYIAKLSLRSPFHIGSGSGSAETDSCVKRDINDKLFVPGTSLAGIMRSLAETIMEYGMGRQCDDPKGGCKCLCCKLFGSRDKASMVFVENGILYDGNGTTEVRDSVGLDRQLQSAQPNVKYDYEVAARDLTFISQIMVDIDESGNPQELALLSYVFAALKAGFGFIGGRSSTGLGEIEFNIQDVYHLCWGNMDTLCTFLLNDDYLPSLSSCRQPGAEGFLGQQRQALTLSAVSYIKRNPSHCLQPNRLTFNFDLQVVEPLLVKGEREPQDFHQQFLKSDKMTSEEAKIFRTTLDRDIRRAQADLEAVQVSSLKADGNRCLYIPGSSLKGVFRSRCEKIIRTLTFDRAQGNNDIYQRKTGACDPTKSKGPSYLLSCAIKLKEEEREWRKQAGEHRSGNKSVAETIYQHSCLACRLFGSAQMRSRLRVFEAYPKRDTVPRRKLFDHLAIDRFTGGALSEAKFNTHPMIYGSFEGKLEIHHFEKWQVGLLSYLFKDLYLEDLRIGHGKYKGFGKIKGILRGITIDCVQGSDLDKELRELHMSPISHPELPDLFSRYILSDDDIFENLIFSNPASPWKSWLEECTQAFAEELDDYMGSGAQPATVREGC